MSRRGNPGPDKHPAEVTNDYRDARSALLRLEAHNETIELVLTLQLIA